MLVKRFSINPLITPSDFIGTNINGPSIIKTPVWIVNPLGRYYMYFAAHKGKFIRLAYSDSIDGEWTVFGGETLKNEDAFFTEHIASPDVHIDEENKKIVMFFHGKDSGVSGQFTRIAVSDDGINFTANSANRTTHYWRGFFWNGHYYGMNMDGNIFRSDSLLGEYEKGPNIFAPLNVIQRHMAVYLKNDKLYIFFSIKETTPEHIVVSTLDLTEDWKSWRLTDYKTVILPETEYEGADLPIERSEGGQILVRARQLRDPAIYTEDGRIYLFYSIAGESGIAGAEILSLD